MMIFTIAFDRYVENNVRLSSQCCQYNAEVTQYLHDRPSSLVNHCLERLLSAADVRKECIQVIDEERGSFKVKSQDPNAQACWYNLSFGDNRELTNRRLLSRRRHLLLKILDTHAPPDVSSHQASSLERRRLHKALLEVVLARARLEVC